MDERWQGLDRPRTPGPGKPAEEPPDLATALVLQMTAVLVANPPTQVTIINVADEAGTITLSGQVSTLAVRTLAERIAAGHPGVRQTINDLEVVPSARPPSL